MYFMLFLNVKIKGVEHKNHLFKGCQRCFLSLVSENANINNGSFTSLNINSVKLVSLTHSQHYLISRLEFISIHISKTDFMWLL